MFFSSYFNGSSISSASLKTSQRSGSQQTLIHLTLLKCRLGSTRNGTGKHTHRHPQYQQVLFYAFVALNHLVHISMIYPLGSERQWTSHLLVCDIVNWFRINDPRRLHTCCDQHIIRWNCSCKPGARGGSSRYPFARALWFSSWIWWYGLTSAWRRLEYLWSFGIFCEYDASWGISIE